MEKLNELMSKACLASELGKKGITVDLQTLSQLRDEVWTITRRAEAAEAKLAELAKQKPVGTVSIAMDWKTHRNVATVNMRHDLVVSEMKDGDELFTRPAPAAELVELVPDKWSLEQALKFVEDYTPPSEEESVLFAVNSFRAAILRNIEEAK